ncbi:MAG: hypothetical protein ACM33V_14460 [Chloroflexota bacterium]|nr:hypothetical protein [Anaerolineales bacterium]
MLFKNTLCLWYGLVPFALVTMACAAYAYSVNAQRTDDDPQKRDFHPLAILLAPITLPFFTVVAIGTFVVEAVLFAAILVLFLAALIFSREPVILRWVRKKALAIGNRLLELNTALIRLWKPMVAQPGVKKGLASRFI